MNFNRKSILAAAVAMALSSGAHADLISFDTNGAGAGGLLTGVATFDWAPGSALAVGAVPLASVGQAFTLLYQANLSTLLNASNLPIFVNGGGGSFFTAVAGFNEVVTSLSPSGATFGLGAGSSFFKICAHSAGANDLTGAGFACSTPILSGTVSAVNSSNFSIASTTPVLLDQSPDGIDQWGGQTSVTGSGASSINVHVTSVDSTYFPSFDLVKTLVFSFFNSSQVVPFNQVEPSKCMTTDGVTDCNHTTTLGGVNGLFTGTLGSDFIFQADANQSFVVSRIPEPGTVALLGMALGVAGLLSRRRAKKPDNM